MANRVPSKTHQVAFNTGRHCTTHGQRIVAWVEKTDDGSAAVACFIDFDQQISEYFRFQPTGQIAMPSDFARHVLHMYDWGQYPLCFVDGLRMRLHEVLRAGYDACVKDPRVHPLGRLL